ncbi:MAG: glycosyl hydrolase, repeat [Thermoleophilia bacterium]|nr:glycosyl hydrolase, repeat [Thermoleophilia bacterium]
MRRMPLLPISLHRLVALAFACATVVACLGTSASSGASSPLNVTATMGTQTTLDMSGCSGATLDLGSLTVSSTATTAASPCHIEFDSNLPSRLAVHQRDGDGAAMTQARTTMDTRSGVPSFKVADAVDASDIWVAGARVNATDPTPLRHTVDGGATWADVTACASTGGTITLLAVWSASELFTASGNKVCRSTDTGATWATITTPLSFAGRMSVVQGTDVVWATASGAGKLMRSTDRGVTWSAVTAPTATTTLTNVVGWGTTNAVAFNTVTAGDGLSRTAYSYTTTDSGATWTQSTIATIPVTTVLATTGTLQLLDRSASGRLIAMGGWAQGNQFKQYYSDDDGATWVAQAIHPITDQLRWIGGTTWMGGGRMNVTQVSHDDGLTWSNVTIGGGSSEFMNRVSAARSGSVVVVGDGSAVYRTTDNAATFTSISPSYSMYLAVVAFDAQRIGVVATDGSAAYTTDGGVTMQAGTGCGAGYFRDGVATGPTSGVVVGNSGKVCRTTDAGQTWSIVPSGTGVTLLEVTRVLRTGDLIAHGTTAATFIRSSDGGLTWQAMSMGVAGAVSLFAVDDDASTMAIARGTYGTMWVSTDSGATWSAQDDGLNSSLLGIAVSPSGGRIVTGHYATPGDGITKTALSTDGGVTWSSAQIGAGNGEASGVDFVSEQRVWALAGNRVHVSDDGGASFTTVANSAGSPTNLIVLDANTVMASGLGKLLTITRPTVSIPDVSPATGLTTASGGFGACLLTATNATPAWPMSGTCSPAAATAWRPAPADAADPATTIVTSASGLASADLVFGMRAGATQTSGSFLAHLVYEVVAP